MDTVVVGPTFGHPVRLTDGENNPKCNPETCTSNYHHILDLPAPVDDMVLATKESHTSETNLPNTRTVVLTLTRTEPVSEEWITGSETEAGFGRTERAEEMTHGTAETSAHKEGPIEVPSQPCSPQNVLPLPGSASPQDRVMSPASPQDRVMSPASPQDGVKSPASPQDGVMSPASPQDGVKSLGSPQDKVPVPTGARAHFSPGSLGGKPLQRPAFFPGLRISRKEVAGPALGFVKGVKPPLLSGPRLDNPLRKPRKTAPRRKDSFLYQISQFLNLDKDEDNSEMGELKGEENTEADKPEESEGRKETGQKVETREKGERGEEAKTAGENTETEQDTEKVKGGVPSTIEPLESSEPSENLEPPEPLEPLKAPASGAEAVFDAFKAFFTPKPPRRDGDKGDTEAVRRTAQIFERASKTPEKNTADLKSETMGDGEDRSIPGRLHAVWPPTKHEIVGLKYTEAEHQAGLLQLKRECKEEVEKIEEDFRRQLNQVRGDNDEYVYHLQCTLVRLQSDLARGAGHRSADLRDVAVSTADNLLPRAFRTVCVQTDRLTFLGNAENEGSFRSPRSPRNVPKRLDLPSISLNLSGNTPSPSSLSGNTPSPSPLSGNTPSPSSLSGNTPSPTPLSGNTPSPSSLSGNTPSHSPLSGNTPSHASLSGNTPSPSPLSGNTPSPSSLSGNTPSPSPLSGNTPSPSSLSGNTPSPSPLSGNTPSPSSLSGNTPSPSPLSGNTPSPSSLSKNTPSPSPLPTVSQLLPSPPPPPQPIPLQEFPSDKIVPPPPIPPQLTNQRPDGLPPPPPLLGGPNFFALMDESPRKPAVEPAFPMKPLYWTRIQIQDNNSNTLWNSLEEVDIINATEFAEMFSKTTVPTKRKPLAHTYEKRAKAKEIVKLLDGKRSQAVGILISSLHLEMKDIRRAVLDLDNSVVDLETIQALYDNRAQPDELEKLQKHCKTSEEKLLDKPERFLHELSRIPDFPGRASCVILQSVFKDGIASLQQKLDVVSRVCKHLLEKSSVREVMGLILALGNHMNGGNRTRGQADGFGLEILPKLKDVKSRDNRISLVDYMVSYYLQNLDKNAGTERSVFPLPEPQDVFLAAQVKFEVISKDLRQLRRDLTVCEKGVQKVCSGSSGEYLQPFKGKMGAFILTAHKDLKEADSQLIFAQKRFQDLAAFLGLKPRTGTAQMDTGHFFMLWFEFCADFKTSWKRENKNISKVRLKEAQLSVKKITADKGVETRKVKPNSLKERLRQKEASLVPTS